MGLGENIRYLRTQRGYSQDYLAEQLGYKSYTTIQKWESGVSEPPIKKFKELALLLDVDINDLANKDLTLEDTLNEEHYYLNEETKDMAQAIFENKELRVLFDAARDSSPEDLQTVHSMLLALKRKEQGNSDEGC